MAQDSQTTADLGPALVRGIWAAVIIAVIIVILRVFAKIKIRQFRVDDVLMIVAMILAVISTVFLTLCVQHGFGKNLKILELEQPHEVEVVLKYIAIQVPIVTISTTIARCSFILYLLAILGNNKNYQLALWVVMVLQFAGNIVSAVLPLSICRNVNILWDPTTKTTCGDVTAVIKFAYYSNSANSACDLFLAVFPTLIFWNLNLKLRIKISLIILLSLGIVAMIASIIKTTKLDSVPSVTNLGVSGGVELIRWGYVENAIIIITSSVPCIRPLIISSVRKFSSRGYSRSYELTGPATAQRRTGHDETAQTRRTRRFTKNATVDTGSIERILDPTNHTNTTVSGRRDSPTHLDQGITKQVEISVISNDQSHLLQLTITMYQHNAIGLTLASLLLLGPHSIAASKSTLGQTPQMGWNSWNTFKSNINASVAENTVQWFQTLGLKDAGYEYILLDEGWSDYSRTADGYLQPNLTSFPDGIKTLVDDIHAKGLKIGLYGDSGILTCGFRPGSWGYEERDAQTLASWGAMTEPPQVRFGVMQKALELAGREILYSVCEWGYQFPWHWGGKICHSYRMSGDITAKFTNETGCACKTAYCLNTGYAGCSVLSIIRKMREISQYQTQGHWLDMDMLEIGNGDMTLSQQQTHFAFGAALKSPLIIGADLSKLSNDSLAVLKNRDIIAVNQDSLGRPVHYIEAASEEGSWQGWAGQVRGGYVVLLLTEKSYPQDLSLGKVEGYKGVLQSVALSDADV
ncbi:glycoside hydrolase family 27 protein [Aspergillus thermomutatus]|uniref:Alpha-galactosidase n=1 Tax=Aspergillus thermomutatus TaxID=41047 RepID=A0A397HAS7_ASPTH|nr:uncharacterized protein CDV56_107058 [Aspergillus thermomutatus]RHZ57490.1 hypothetical protein CDV56_107058 [Aspergillus thermomutatus]